MLHAKYILLNSKLSYKLPVHSAFVPTDTVQEITSSEDTCLFNTVDNSQLCYFLEGFKFKDCLCYKIKALSFIQWMEGQQSYSHLSTSQAVTQVLSTHAAKCRTEVLKNQNRLYHFIHQMGCEGRMVESTANAIVSSSPFSLALHFTLLPGQLGYVGKLGADITPH